MPDAFLSLPTFPRVSEYAGVWAIWPHAFNLHCERVRQLDFKAHLADFDEPEPKSLIQMEPVANGKSIARIPIVGLMMKQRSSLGGTSTVQVRRDVRDAANNPDVSAILLEIESPGGTVSGLEALANDVRSARARKPVWAFVDDLAASAAYYVASQAEQIVANGKNALIGSIGTLMTVYDASALYANEGVKPHVFATGPLKGAGTSGTPITEEQQAYFQGIVDGSQREFDAAVKRGRGFTDSQLKAVRTGGVWLAPEAADLKLIDGTRSLEKTIAELAASAARRSRA